MQKKKTDESNEETTKWSKIDSMDWMKKRWKVPFMCGNNEQD